MNFQHYRQRHLVIISNLNFHPLLILLLKEGIKLRLSHNGAEYWGKKTKGDLVLIKHHLRQL